MLERNVQHEIRLELGVDEDLALWRNNIGVAEIGGRKVAFGVGGPGGADLCGLLRVGPGIGLAVYIEVKAQRGRQSQAQRDFQAAVERRGGQYAICRSAAEARAWIDGLRAKYAGRVTE